MRLSSAGFNPQPHEGNSLFSLSIALILLANSDFKLTL